MTLKTEFLLCSPDRCFVPGAWAALMKSSRRKKKKDFKAAEERLMEALKEIEKAALGDKSPTRSTDLANDEEAHKQTPTRRPS